MIASENLIPIIINAMADIKARDITTLDVRGISTVTDFMVIASGSSNRQVSAIAKNVVDKAKMGGQRPLGLEGEREGEWILVDFGDVVVHIMQPQTRDFYQLEKLWSVSIT
jgi:ribosome-associated protein